MSDLVIWVTDDDVPRLWNVPTVEAVSSLKSYLLSALGLESPGGSETWRWSPWLTEKDHKMEVRLWSQGTESLGCRMAPGHAVLINDKRSKTQTRDKERQEGSVTPEEGLMCAVHNYTCCFILLSRKKNLFISVVHPWQREEGWVECYASRNSLAHHAMLARFIFLRVSRSLVWFLLANELKWWNMMNVCNRPFHTHHKLKLSGTQIKKILRALWKPGEKKF